MPHHHSDDPFNSDDPLTMMGIAMVGMALQEMAEREAEEEERWRPARRFPAEQHHESQWGFAGPVILVIIGLIAVCCFVVAIFPPR